MGTVRDWALLMEGSIISIDSGQCDISGDFIISGCEIDKSITSISGSWESIGD